MKKTIFSAVVWAALCFTVATPTSAPAEDIPIMDTDAERLVRAFYTWYLQETLRSVETRTLPQDDDAILQYVWPCTVYRLRADQKQGLMDADYFTKGQDFWPEMLDDLTTDRAVSIGKDLALIAVGLIKGEAPDIIVYVRRDKGRWSIIRVEDAYYPYPL